MGAKIRIACPSGYEPTEFVMKQAMKINQRSDFLTIITIGNFFDESFKKP